MDKSPFLALPSEVSLTILGFLHRSELDTLELASHRLHSFVHTHTPRLPLRPIQLIYGESVSSGSKLLGYRDRVALCGVDRGMAEVEFNVGIAQSVELLKAGCDQGRGNKVVQLEFNNSPSEEHLEMVR